MSIFSHTYLRNTGIQPPSVNATVGMPQYPRNCHSKLVCGYDEFH